MNINPNNRIIEFGDQEFVVTERDPYASAVNGQDEWFVIGQYCNLLAAQDSLLRRGVLAWSTYLMADDGCTCSEHNHDEEEVSA